ncbi:GNAT family N-acetyltransferase [Paenibacillus sp. EC2-1]|uniref:GNAT family N-acetyltransferase n=1 Tax=Paenibacillus sp. EC2-1 TaxID=3388665 RepID=UPI003BEECAE6
MYLVWKDYDQSYANEINQWLKHHDTYKYTEIEDWHVSYKNIIDGIDFYYANGSDGEKCYYKLNDDYYCKVVFDQEQLIAVLDVYINPLGTEIIINPIIVSPSYQGRGYGTLIINEFTIHRNKILKEGAFSKISVVIERGNIPSIRCFEKCGFMYVNDSDNGAFLIYEYELV